MPTREPMPLIAAFQRDEALVADIRAHSRGTDRFSLWWLGQSGFLLAWDGQFLLLDPYLSDSLSEKYAGSDKPHVRISERVIDPALLSMAHWVTSSHNHTDHLDAATLLPLAQAAGGIELVLPEANIDFARRRLEGAKVEFHGVNAGTAVRAGAFEITGIAAAHNTVERDSAGRCLYLGCVVKFGPFSVYHSGDTLWHDSLVADLLPHRVDAALVPINGNKPERRVAGNLNGAEAAALAKAIGARLAIPHHFDMFAFNTDTPEEFVRVCGQLGQPCQVLRGGERAEIPSRQ